MHAYIYYYIYSNAESLSVSVSVVKQEQASAARMPCRLHVLVGSWGFQWLAVSGLLGAPW